jgi:hypothetical protein
MITLQYNRTTQRLSLQGGREMYFPSPMLALFTNTRLASHLATIAEREFIGSPCSVEIVR